ncbi:MAG: type III secretion system translocon subunit SctE [Victivallaceae bacterium]
MTSGVSGSGANEAQQLQNIQQQLAAAKEGSQGTGKGHDTKNSTSLHQLTEQAAAGMEEMISEGQVGKTSKKDASTETTKTSKKSTTSGKDNIQRSTETATAQAIRGPQSTRANAYELPSLPEPSASVNGVVLKKNMGTLALLGLVMTLMAQASSKSWSMDFQQQNQAIQNQVQMAPEIGQAIRTQAEHQSAATQAQATQSLISGITNIASFAVSAGMGIFSAAKAASGVKSASFTSETAGSAASQASTTATNVGSRVSGSLDDIAGATTGATQQATSRAASSASEITQGTTGVLGQTGSQAGRVGENVTGVLDDAINTPSWKDKLSRGMNVFKEQGGRAAAFAGETFAKSMQVAQVMNLLSQGIDGIVGSVYGSQVAAHQKQAGIAEAQSAELQQMASVMDKYASQAQSMGDQAQSTVQNALQTIQNVADSMTQTSAAIFS